MNTADTRFIATSTGARAAFMALAAVITFSLLGAVGGVADRQFDQALMAQAAAPLQLAASAPAAPRG